ncbi:hypothetical protein NDI85_10450 [Halomicroarcula sp. S1AR25-4]|uniref:hypothetical protein n=1 Tax=Haloarcula sp. S1AR25-4 TaxID=2950538 RepID=UPI002876A319|nr:hypothetical protein [Halomicroarcula sp. S1AR25-4]MDS0278216.1 hypothetical protein [Halomicroarcula sp. S1AR25-4]
MGKLDGHRYPEKLTADGAVKIAEILVEELDGKVSSKQVFADALGHSTAKSGSYITKVADARNYGILPKQGLEATDLAYRVAHPKDDAEYRDAIFEMYQNVTLLSELYDHLDGNEPPSNLWSVLTEITGANRNEAKEAASGVRALYEEMLEYDSEETSESEESTLEEDSDDNPTVVPTANTADGDGIFLKIGGDEHRFAEVNDLNIEIAVKILQSKKEQESQSDDEDDLVQAKLKPETE